MGASIGSTGGANILALNCTTGLTQVYTNQREGADLSKPIGDQAG